MLTAWTLAPPGPTPEKRAGGGDEPCGKKGQQNPRKPLLLEDFLVPKLDEEFYGKDLEWVDRSRGKFFISWKHLGSKSFNREGPNVFRDWSVMKGTWDDQVPSALSDAKHRVRDAFHKLPDITLLEDGTDHRIYRINNIQKYPVQDNEDESKENKKKRGLCGCLTGCPDCEPQEQPLKSRAKMSDDLDQDMDNLQEIDNKSYAGSSGTQNSRSMSPSIPSSDFSPTKRSLTEASYKPSRLPGSSCKAKAAYGAVPSVMTRNATDMETAYILLSLKCGGRWQQQPPQSAADPFAPLTPGNSATLGCPPGGPSGGCIVAVQFYSALC
ncbi:hypothetical protein MTO96_003868 [Rhipicephalus appendiculatus]